MNRQYIGARYVPRFLGTYDTTQIYEALDVVDNGLGTTYISKKTVPAGTPLTDTEFWAIYGASSGAIINLQNQIDDMNDGSITGSLQYQINDTNEKKLTRIPYRKVLFLGDSYDVVIPGESWSDRVAANLEISDYVVRSAGGLGLNPANPSNTWKQYLTSNPVSDPDTITDVVICGGMNDINNSLTDLSNALATLKAYLDATFVNLERVYFGFIGWSLSYANRPKCMLTSYNYQRAAVVNNCRSLCGVDNILKNAKFIEDSNPSDLDHPNIDGINALGVGIANAIATGYCNNYAINTVGYTIDTTNFTGSIWGMSERIRNDMYSVMANDITLVTQQALGSGFHKIGNTPNLNDSSMPRNRGWLVSAYDVTNAKWFPARIISEHAGEISLWLQGDYTLGNNVTFKIIGSQWTEILH